MPEIIAYLLVAVLGVVLTVFIYRANHYKALWTQQYEVYTETLDRALEAEHDLGHLTQEHENLKETFRQTLQMLNGRQSVAVMTDAQVNLISQTIAQLVVSQGKLPN